MDFGMWWQRENAYVVHKAGGKWERENNPVCCRAALTCGSNRKRGPGVAPGGRLDFQLQSLCFMLETTRNPWMVATGLIHSFPGDAVTDYHRVSGLTNTFWWIISQLWRSEVSWNQGIGRAVFLQEALEEKLFPCFLQLLEAACFPWLVLSSIFKVSSHRIPTSASLCAPLPWPDLLPPSFPYG